VRRPSVVKSHPFKFILSKCPFASIRCRNSHNPSVIDNSHHKIKTPSEVLVPYSIRYDFFPFK
jgi:hypothetical protein